MEIQNILHMRSRFTSVWTRLAFVLALALSISACGSGGGNSDVDQVAAGGSPPTQPADPTAPGE
jgi:hypothetical protein